MAPVFKRVSALNSSSPLKATGLIPVNDPTYNYRKSGQVLESLVYTLLGTFSQIVAPSNVEPGGIEGPSELKTFHVPLDAEENGTELTDAAVAKKERQWLNWSRKVIPSMIVAYLTLLRESENLSKMDRSRHDDWCPGCNVGRSLSVSCIYFERELINYQIFSTY